AAAGPAVVQDLDDGLTIVECPMVGTFYAAPSPGAADFVEVGTRVKSGQVLCIIEAMKLMNEIEAEIAGEIVEMCIDNAQTVQFGQPLFKIRPA
ncbi:MAG: acetyl-CoA carboxylase biotin carboxyl carrier protein, partial [Kiritimatiellia bacterium]